MPDIPEHPDPKKPSDYLGHMSTFCTDMIKDIESTKELGLAQKVLLMSGLKQLRMQIKQIHAELNAPKEEKK